MLTKGKEYLYNFIILQKAENEVHLNYNFIEWVKFIETLLIH